MITTMAEERQPLLQGTAATPAHTLYGGSTPPAHHVLIIVVSSAGGTEGTLVSPVGPDELPPPYTPSSSGVPMVTCRVCQAMIDISGKVDQHVVKCNQCNEATFNTLNNALARCPHCRKVSSVGPEFARCRGIVFVVVALGFLGLGIALTCTTISYTKNYPGIYVAYIVAFLISAILFYRTIYYCSMKISLIEGPL
ncbi:Type 1 phosphatidylinositol 4,5-bisphosphate 4-phosphatase [Chionoecetes opilio]|uniref:Phosphatidylinositol-4,5-bisphosphate 4-phosphatase n=1 Tax=Chionoecetes opilio TaxID=41210 RepID=A0A8J4XUP6_CHIOP|nr:Type 1 phosphatidylinositol 4,5-bisphosphate 4-phosphatase [Chionoecetes opilio]